MVITVGSINLFISLHAFYFLGGGVLTEKQDITLKPPLPKRKKKNFQDCKLQEQIDEAFSILKTSTLQSRKKDELDVYGELLVSKLRNLEEQTRDIAMNRIDNLLFELKMNNPIQYRQNKHPINSFHSMLSPSSSQTSASYSYSSSHQHSPNTQVQTPLSSPQHTYTSSRQSPFNNETHPPVNAHCQITESLRLPVAIDDLNKSSKRQVSTAEAVEDEANAFSVIRTYYENFE